MPKSLRINPHDAQTCQSDTPAESKSATPQLAPFTSAEPAHGARARQGDQAAAKPAHAHARRHRHWSDRPTRAVRRPRVHLEQGTPVRAPGDRDQVRPARARPADICLDARVMAQRGGAAVYLRRGGGLGGPSGPSNWARRLFWDGSGPWSMWCTSWSGTKSSSRCQRIKTCSGEWATCRVATADPGCSDSDTKRLWDILDLLRSLSMTCACKPDSTHCALSFGRMLLEDANSVGHACDLGPLHGYKRSENGFEPALHAVLSKTRRGRKGTGRDRNR
jgi:hypothetical protein